MPHQEVGQGHCSPCTARDGERGSECRDCPMRLTCAAATLWLPLVISGCEFTQEIPQHMGRERRIMLLEAGCLCPLGKCVLVLGVVLGSGFVTFYTMLWMQPLLRTLRQET